MFCFKKKEKKYEMNEKKSYLCDFSGGFKLFCPINWFFESADLSEIICSFFCPSFMANPEREFKVCLLGAPGVGRSSLVIRVVTGNFIVDFDPTLDDNYRKMMQVDGHVVVLDLSDYPSFEEFTAMRDHLIISSEIFIIVYSVIDLESFQKVQEFLEMIYLIKERGDLSIMIVGTKTDLVEESGRAVEKEEAEDYAKLHDGVMYMETSSKSGENVHEIFEEGVRRQVQIEKVHMGAKDGAKTGDVPPPVVHDISRGKAVKPAKR